jgi:uncharacterized membrane-anchored protein
MQQAARLHEAAHPGAGNAKLPHVTLAFWIMKIAATTLGETGGDLLSMTLHIGYVDSSLLLIALLGVVMAAQFAVRRYHPFLFWSVILLTSTAGTTMSDMLDRSFHLGYPRGAALLTTLLCMVFLVWRASGEALDFHRIRSRTAELLFWTAILFSNTLGTALGDFLADSSGLGFAGGAILIGALLAVLALAYFVTSASRTLLFWAAFVLTRPFGATLGDVLTKPVSHGGLGFGTIGASLALLGVLLAFVLHAQLRRGEAAARRKVLF